MNYQKIIVVGNATAAAEQQKSKNGNVDYTTFRLGVSDGREDTTFFSITVFGKLGKSIAMYITKGREILVEGRVSVGEKGYFNIVADQVRLGTQPEKPDKKTKKQNPKK